MILTPSLNRCASLLDDKKVDRVDLGWVTVTQGLTKRAWKAFVKEVAGESQEMQLDYDWAVYLCCLFWLCLDGHLNFIEHLVVFI